MKAKLSNREGMLKLRRRFSALVKTNSVEVENDASSYDNFPVHRISDVDLSVLKCDILALLKTIEEIENKVRMNRILSLSGNEKASNEEKKSKEKYVRQQFAMLNFGRNYTAV
eukprot:CAMPEP_0205811968 /NCGR_PEP_ID=MMETSP0205-20121125/16274_1 /ASSEMBLY_ACC=CAM_ASM_000278 /TAXON_ID=36767 /ORGANISM="Euplotes focardii, Strain TN1" /LENGTH=112 /DNA_ID=CAMNT_0053091881 /DNA_START=40 /DNA_END=374 /DNA_ORIENTATION=-